MSYPEMAPEELLRLGFAAPRVAEQPWCVRWDTYTGDVEALVTGTVAAEIDFHTSGSTGPAQCWRRTRAKAWAEAGMLADLLRPGRPEAIASFVPPVHLYGGLTSLFVPAILRLPVWFRPGYFGSMPPGDHARWAIIGTPWVFSLLLQHLPWVRARERVTVMHGGAMLPSLAGDFLDRAGPERAEIVEVFGSTEAGGVATRRWSSGNPPPWTLFPDVGLADPDIDGRERPLHVVSPRLAFRPGTEPAARWAMDDHVVALDERRFAFAGRRSRLVNLNGRRYNLDDLEDRLRRVTACADLALVPVADQMIGEHVDLLVVPGPGRDLADVGLAAGYAEMGVRPRRVRVVDTIDRSETGKLRRIQRSVPANAKDDS